VIVGFSSVMRPRIWPILSSSPFLPASMAYEKTGLGRLMSGSTTEFLVSQSVSRVMVFSSLTTTPMSPQVIFGMSTCLLPIMV